MAVSEAQKKASKKYFDNKEGYSRAGFIRESVKENMERDGNLKYININSNSLRNLINSRNTEKEKIE